MPVYIFLFILSLFHTCSSLTCSELQENQCKNLEINDCIWSGEICSGTYSPSCIPPSCYYIDSSSTSTSSPDGTHEKPFETLTQGFTKLSGKDGTLIIVNRFEEMGVDLTATATISSQITIQPLFDDTRYKIDVSNLPSSTRLVFNVKKYLRVIGASLTTNFSIEAVVFSLASAEVYLEDVEIIDIPEAISARTLMARATGSTSIFSMTDCRIANVIVIFQISAGKAFWKNVYVSGTNLLSNLLGSKTMMTMEDCFFTGTLMTQPFIRASLAEVSLRNCIFRELAAANIITGFSPTSVSIKDCIFDQIIYVNQQGLLSFAPVSQQPFEVMMNNCSFTNIQVKTSIFALQGPDGSLSLMNVNMTNITQNKESPTRIIVTNTITWSQGLCIASVGNAEISIESSNFSNIGSHCLWLEDTALNLADSIFDNSKLDIEETPILREDLSSLTEYSGASWVRIKATAAYEEQASQAVITNNKFIQNGLRPKYGGAIRVTGVFPSEMQISGNDFIANTAYYGGAIYSDNAFASLELSDNVFNGNSAYNGGALYKISIESDEKLSRVSLSTDNDQFLENIAVKNGGAMYLNWESIYFSNTEFISNNAANGGAIYYINLDETYHSKYGGMTNVDFIENSASNIGGSMKLFFEYSALKIDERVLVFKDNLDLENSKEGISQGRPAYYFLSFYDITSQNQPKITDNLQDWIDNSDRTKLAFTMNTSDTTMQFPVIQQKSGNEISQIIKVQVFDNENRLADYINDEEVKFEIVSFENSFSNFPASLVYNSIKFQFERGQFLAKGTIKIHGEPNTTAILQLQNIAGHSDFIQDSGMTGSCDLQVRFMDCEIGDIFETQTRSCSACAAGSYTIDDPYKATYCNECPANLDCLGGNKIGPKAGYWMYNLEALTAIECPYSPACLGSFGSASQQYSVQGECEYPHQGNLCNQCAPKYAKFGNSARCRNCENDVMYYVRLVLFFLIQVGVVLCILKLNCGEQSERSTFYLSIIKILVSFVQMSSVIISHDLNWSVLSKDAVDILNKIFPSDKDGFPIDCFLALMLPDNHNINLARLVATFFQPFVLLGLCILIHFLILLHSKERSGLRNKLKASLGSLFVICVFITQPNMVLTALELFKCQNISGPENRELFLTSNSDIRCWTRSHMIWGYGFGLLMFLIWGVILPFILFIKTTGSSWRPFYYQGLRKETFYWEFIMMIIKTLIISVFTVFTSTSRVIQILITLLICLSLTVVFLKLHPYQDPRLHFSSLISFLALTFMCYVGFFFLSNSWSDTQVTVTSILLVILNCAVFVYPIFVIIKDRIKPKIIMGTQTAVETLNRLEKAKPKLTVPETQRALSGKDEDDFHNVSDHEIKIQETVLSDKGGSIDNFTIMQRNGSALFSPNRTSSMLIKYSSTLSPRASREDTLIPRGDFLSSSSTRYKKIFMKRLNMKSTMAKDDENIKVENTERIITEHVKYEVIISTPREETQGETELENLFSTLKTGSVVSKSNEQ